MEEEKIVETKQPNTQNQEPKQRKLAQLLEIAHKKYEKLLRVSLKASKKAYLKGKIDLLKRVSEGVEKMPDHSYSKYKDYLMTKKFEDVPNSKPKNFDKYKGKKFLKIVRVRIQWGARHWTESS